MKKTDNEIDHLLARGKLSGPEEDRLSEEILARTQTTSTAKPFFDISSWFRIAFVAIAVCLLVIPSVIVLRKQTTEDRLYQVKGKTTDHPLIEVSCKNKCQHGDSLIFRVQNLKQTAFFVAYSVSQTHQITWYFPNAQNYFPILEPQESPQFVKDTVEIGDDHLIGTYNVNILLLKEKLTYEQILSGQEKSVQEKTIFKTQQQITIRQ